MHIFINVIVAISMIGGVSGLVAIGYFMALREEREQIQQRIGYSKGFIDGYKDALDLYKRYKEENEQQEEI